jgi:hypothetical protein
MVWQWHERQGNRALPDVIASGQRGEEVDACACSSLQSSHASVSLKLCAAPDPALFRRLGL